MCLRIAIENNKWCRDAERQRDRETERQRDRETERQRGRETDKKVKKEISGDWQMAGETDRHKYKCRWT